MNVWYEVTQLQKKNVKLQNTIRTLTLALDVLQKAFNQKSKDDEARFRMIQRKIESLDGGFK